MTGYRLVAVDLDGTLLRSDSTLSDVTRRTLIRAQEAGMRLIISSGRPTYGVAPIADELRLGEFGGYVVSYNGGELREWATRELIYSRTLDRGLIPILYRYAEESGLRIITYNGGNIITEAPCDDPYVSITSARNHMEVLTVASFVEAVAGLPLAKCMIVGEPSRLLRLEAKMSGEMGGSLGVYRSDPFFLELVPPHIDKAQGLTTLLRSIGCEAGELVAFGDGYNDISMLRLAGLGVAMGNAPDEVKKAAALVTLTNDEDGVASLMKSLLMIGD